MSESMYAEIGGREAVEAVVEDFYEMMLDDEQLVGYFAGHDMQSLYAHQVQFVSSIAGGPVRYSGADMREAHAHLDIDRSDFDAVVEYLERALLENGVDTEQVDVILAEVTALGEPILGRS